MTMHRRSNMSVDNLARGQRTMLSTAEPGTPARGERMSQGEPTPQGQQPIKPHGVHLNPAVRLSKRWGPPLSGWTLEARDVEIHWCGSRNRLHAGRLQLQRRTVRRHSRHGGVQECLSVTAVFDCVRNLSDGRWVRFGDLAIRAAWTRNFNVRQPPYSIPFRRVKAQGLS